MKKIIFLLSVVALGAGLSGCGSDDSGSPAAGYQQAVAEFAATTPENTEPLAAEAFPTSDSPETSEPFAVS